MGVQNFLSWQQKYVLNRDISVAAKSKNTLTNYDFGQNTNIKPKVSKNLYKVMFLKFFR